MNEEWVLSVEQLGEYVRRHLAGDPLLRAVRVRGELSGFKRHTSGHLYFAIKDEKARVQCVMFRQNALSLDFEPRDGQMVVVSGSASLYVASGAFQLYCQGMRREGAGELFLRFEALKEKLSREGLFDPARKRPLPLLPRRVGIVTSPTGAALRDMVRVARRRDPGVDILLCPAQVQGAAAAGEIVAALEALNIGLQNDFADVSHMVRAYDRRRRLVVDGLRNAGLDCFEPGGAFYAFPSVAATGMDCQTFCHKLLESKQVACVPGDAFGALGEGHVRISYAAATDKLVEALGRIAQFVEENRV